MLAGESLGVLQLPMRRLRSAPIVACTPQFCGRYARVTERLNLGDIRVVYLPPTDCGTASKVWGWKE